MNMDGGSGGIASGDEDADQPQSSTPNDDDIQPDHVVNGDS